jgi:nucleotide-binding universal stress UspA family protein
MRPGLKSRNGRRDRSYEISYILAEKIQNEKDLQVSCSSAIGPAGQTIVEFCEKQQIELIALATHGRADPAE